MAQGKWEKSKFVGTELAGKTVGIVGLGQVGSRVASRARAFEARVLGHDPFLPAEKAQEMGVPLVPLETLLAQSDVVTLHSTATDKGKPLIGAAELGAHEADGRARQRRAGKPRRSRRPDGGAAGKNARGRRPRRLRSRASRPERSAAEAAERRRHAAPRRVDGRGAGARLDPDGRGPARGAGRRRLRSRGQLSVSRPQGRERRDGVDAARRADGPLSLGHLERPALAAGDRDVGPAGGHGAAGRRGRGQGRARGPDARHRQLRQRALHGERPRPRGQRHAPRRARELRALDPRDAHGRRVEGKRGRDPLRGQRRPRRGGRPACRSSSGPRARSCTCATATCPGVVGGVGTILGEAGINIADFSLARGDGQRAAAVIAVDTAPPPAVLDRLRGLAAVEEVRVVTW